ncbi:MAG: DnaJ domain-containing protein [Pseudomonadota bacterium]
MPYAGIIVFALLIFFLGVRWFVQADPQQIARVIKRLFLLLILCGVLALVLTGKILPVISMFIALLPLIVPIIVKLRRNTHASSGETHKSSGRRFDKMTRAEAYEILGLNSSASRSEIIAAHRRLMLQMHPDKGGSTYLATKLNQARDILLQ